MNSRKKEASSDHHNKNSTTPSSSSSRQSWASFKNPRIVRVSRSFGGKDRHSKVCTIRGLRDRRIRLSVPTAIQLYDLQERLGLNQPSKVIDWLLDVTKDEIDKLPPLQIPPSTNSFPNFFNPINTSFMKEGIKINNHFDENLREKSILGKDKWIVSSDDQENQGNYVSLISSQNFFQLGNNDQSSMSFNPNLSLAQFGNHSFSSQIEQNNFPISLTSSNSFFGPNSTTYSSMIPPYNMNTSNNNSQLNHFHNLLNSSSQQDVSNSMAGTTLQLISSKGLNSQDQEDDDDDDDDHVS